MLEVEGFSPFRQALNYVALLPYQPTILEEFVHPSSRFYWLCLALGFIKPGGAEGREFWRGLGFVGFRELRASDSCRPWCG